MCPLSACVYVQPLRYLYRYMITYYLGYHPPPKQERPRFCFLCNRALVSRSLMTATPSCCLATAVRLPADGPVALSLPRRSGSLLPLGLCGVFVAASPPLHSFRAVKWSKNLSTFAAKVASFFQPRPPKSANSSPFDGVQSRHCVLLCARFVHLPFPLLRAHLRCHLSCQSSRCNPDGRCSGLLW